MRPAARSSSTPSQRSTKIGGSRQAITTRAMPALIVSRVQLSGREALVEQGSSVE